MKESGLNKFYKILRIIAVTLAIISMVFMLMKKVGLCASAGPSSYPLPYGPGSRIGYGSYNLTQQNVDDVLQLALAYQPTWFTDGYIVTVNEVDETNNTIKLRVAGVTSGTDNAIVEVRGEYDYFSSSSSIGLQRNKVLEYRINSDGTISRTYSGSGNSTQYAQIGGHIVTDVSTREIYIPYDTFIGNYPVAFSDNLTLSYNDVVIFRNDPPHTLGGGEGEITQMPSIDNLTGDPSANDSNPGLFSLLKGWLSTINGTIWQSGKNRENNLTSFFKPYLDRVVAITDWFFEPFDQEQFENEFSQIPLIGDLYTAKGAIENADLFDFSDVEAAQRVAFSFDFGGAVLAHSTYEINFDWYTGSVKTLITTLIVTFLVIGFVYTVVNQIPAIISGNGGDSGGGAST